MTQQQLIYEHVMDGLLRAIGDRRSARLEQRLLEAGWAGPKKKASAYSHATWRRFLAITREELYPELPEAEGYVKLGERFVDGYFQTTLGGAVASIVRLLGPRRTLLRSTQQFRSANNFTETKVTERGPNDIEFWMNVVDQIDFTVGIVRRGVEIAGGKDISVERFSGPDESCTFHVRWG